MFLKFISGQRGGNQEQPLWNNISSCVSGKENLSKNQKYLVNLNNFFLKKHNPPPSGTH